MSDIVDVPDWQIEIKNGLCASFFQPDGSSRPGTDWSVRMVRGAEVRALIVRIYLPKGADPAGPRDVRREAQAVVNAIVEQVQRGWDPATHESRAGEPALVVDSLRPPEPEASGHKPWWKLW